MKTLPFSKWTLQFYCTRLATQYQEYILSQRLIYFRSTLCAALLNSFLSLIISIIQLWSYQFIIIVSIHIVLHVLGLVISKKCSPYFDLIFPFIYIAYYVSTILLSIYDISQLQYLFGYLNGVLLSSLLGHSTVKMQAIFLSTNIIIILGVFGGFALINLNYISYAIGTNLLQFISAYINEYNSRLCFSQSIIINQQKNLMYDLISEQLIILSFDKKKQAFDQYFVNQKFEQIYKIENNQDKLNQFLRNHFIVNLDKNKIPSSLKVLKFCNKQITLESYLYKKFETDIEEEIDQVQVEMTDQQNNQNRIKILTKNGITPLIIIIINQINDKIEIEKYEKKIHYIKQSQINFSILIGQKLQTIYNQVFDLEINQNQLQIFNKIKGSIQFILNEYKNQIIYFSQFKNSQLLSKIDNYLLSTYINALQPYFNYYSQNFQKHFELIFSIDQDNTYMKINTKLLTQLLINVFNKIIYYSKSHSAIVLQLSKEFNLNPLYSIQQSSYKSSVSKYDYLCSSSESNQLLIIFKFTFTTDEKIDNFESLFISQKKEFEQQGEDLICLVNSQILRQISPYNQIFISQEQRYEYQFVNAILTLYIYSDQTQIDQSYCQNFKKPEKYIEQGSLLI